MPIYTYFFNQKLNFKLVIMESIQKPIILDFTSAFIDTLCLIGVTYESINSVLENNNSSLGYIARTC